MDLVKRIDLDETYSNDNIKPVFDLNLMSKEHMDLFADTFSTMIDAAINCNDSSVVSDVFKEYLALVFQEGGHRVGNHIRVFFMQLIEQLVKSEHFKSTGQKVEDFFECLAYPTPMLEAMRDYTDSQLETLQEAIEQVIDVPAVREYIKENNLGRNEAVSALGSWEPLIFASAQYNGCEARAPFNGDLESMGYDESLRPCITKLADKYSDNNGMETFISSYKTV
jgi:hypothetical protein